MFYDFSPDGIRTVQINLSNVSSLEWGRNESEDEGPDLTIRFTGDTEPMEFGSVVKSEAAALKKALNKFKDSP